MTKGVAADALVVGSGAVRRDASAGSGTLAGLLGALEVYSALELHRPPGDALVTDVRGRWADAACRLASRVGLSAQELAMSAREVVMSADPQRPRAAWVEAPGGAGRWVLVVGRKGSRAEAVVVSAEGRRRERVDAAALAALCGAPSASVELRWVAFGEGLPLGALADDGVAVAKEDKPWRRLRALVQLERGDLWVVVAFAAMVGVLTLVTPLAVQALVNTVAFGALLQPLIVLMLVLLVGLAFAGALRVLEGVAVEYLQRRIFVRVVSDLSRRLPRVAGSVQARHHTPELVNRFFEVMTVQKAAATLLLDGLEVALQMAIGMVVLAFYHPFLLAFDVVLLAAIVALVVVFGRGATRTSLYESDAKYAVAAWLEELPASATLFKSRRGEDHAVRQADRLARAYLAARGKHYSVVLRQIVVAVCIQVVFSAALLGLGGWLVLEGELTLGQLVASELIVTMVVAGVVKSGKLFEKFYDLLAGVEKLGKLVDLPLEAGVGQGPAARAEGAALSVQGVSEARGGRVNLLEGVTVEVGAGQRVAILADDDTGSAALFDLLYGLEQPDVGCVLYDGIDMRDISLAEMRDQVGFVREAELTAGTIIENVCMGRDAADVEVARDALVAVGLLDAVRQLPDGLQTSVTTSGAPLTPSQALQLTLARVLASQPRLILIDEALDRMRPGDRDAALDALFAPGTSWSIVVATRNRKTAERCERILRLRRRTIEEVVLR